MKFRSTLLLAVFSLFIQSTESRAAWLTDGNPIAQASGSQLEPTAVTDGAGGAIMVWADNRNGTYDIFAQRVNANGVSQWTANGVPVRVALNQQSNPTAVADGAGGAIVFWEHVGNNGLSDIYAQHILSNGSQQWLNPAAICLAQHDQLSPRAIPDGSGGAIVTWQDNRAGSTMVADVYAQRVDAAGTVLWTSDGVAICVASQKQEFARLASDGAGGAIIAWTDFRDGLTYSIYARRVNAAGTAQWSVDGNLIAASTGWEIPPAIAIDGAGGAIIAWQGNGGDANIYAQRVAQGGSIQWGASGVFGMHGRQQPDSAATRLRQWRRGDRDVAGSPQHRHLHG